MFSLSCRFAFPSWEALASEPELVFPYYWDRACPPQPPGKKPESNLKSNEPAQDNEEL